MAVLLIGSENINVGMPSNFFELICFKHSMVIDSYRLYILVLV